MGSRRLALAASAMVLLGAPALAQPKDANKASILPAQDKVASRPGDRNYAESVAKGLGGTLISSAAYRVPARELKLKGQTKPESWPAFRALRLRVRLEGAALDAIRIRTGSAEEAARIQGELVDPKTGERMIMDQRGAELVFVWGSKALAKPARAAQHLAAIWGAGKPVEAKRGTIAVVPAVGAGDFNFAVFTQSNGNFYQASARMFRIARVQTEKGISSGGGLTWSFVDAPQNEIRVDSKAFHLHGLVSPKETMTFSMCGTKAIAEAEWAYLLELLKERKTPPKRSKGMLEVLKEGARARD